MRRKEHLKRMGSCEGDAQSLDREVSSMEEGKEESRSRMTQSLKAIV